MYYFLIDLNRITFNIYDIYTDKTSNNRTTLVQSRTYSIVRTTDGFLKLISNGTSHEGKHISRLSFIFPTKNRTLFGSRAVNYTPCMCSNNL